VGSAWVAARCPPSCSITPLLKRTGGENTMQKFVGRDKDREITQQLPSQAKQTSLGENNLIYFQLITKLG